jgi:hypothetical protein
MGELAAPPSEKEMFEVEEEAPAPAPAAPPKGK